MGRLDSMSSGIHLLFWWITKEIMVNRWYISGLWGFLAAWRALFDRFDVDGSGNINFQEYSNALAGMH